MDDVITCTAEEWEKNGAAMIVARKVRQVRLTTWPGTDISDVMDAEDAAMSSRAIVAAVIAGRLSELYPGVEFELPNPS